MSTYHHFLDSDDYDVELDDDNTSVMQWQVAGNGMYVAAGRTVAAIPPGTYQVRKSRRGPVLKATAFRTDKLARIPGDVAERVIALVERFWQLETSSKPSGEGPGFL